ncbi:MAG: bacteriohopanetetrol glucosamine biosynthesis glycosyltransferase HpnI [Candidatus Binatia bacterium]
MATVLDNVGLLQIPILIGLVASGIFYVIELYSAREFFAPRPLANPGYQPTVSVLKPLKGLDIGLYDNLSTLCRQSYPTFQLLFGVADSHDPAAAVVRRLQRDYPHLDIELVVDARIHGANYKVSNLHNMYQHARHEVIVLADSDIRVGPDYLTRVVQPLHDPQVGLSTCIYRAINTGGLPTLIESLFINTDFAALVMLARKVETSTYAFGATIAMRRDVLDRIGGFLPIANVLADDYELGNRIAKLGYRLELSPEVVDTVLAIGSWRRLYDHQVRWARTYRVNRPGGYFGSILTHGTFWAVVNVLYNGFSPLSCLASGALIALRYHVAARMAWQHLQTNASGWQLLLVGPKDLFLTFVWFAAFAGNTVVWSGRQFQVQRSGEMVDLTDATPVEAGAPHVESTPGEAPDRRHASGR